MPDSILREIDWNNWEDLERTNHEGLHVLRRFGESMGIAVPCN